jgi:hypothetical protein
VVGYAAQAPDRREASAHTVTLLLSATDDVSGVGHMRLSGAPTFAGAAWQTYTPVYSWSVGGEPAVYVQYRDNAGNVSLTYSASLPASHRQFLPLILR